MLYGVEIFTKQLYSFNNITLNAICVEVSVNSNQLFTRFFDSMHSLWFGTAWFSPTTRGH